MGTFLLALAAAIKGFFSLLVFGRAWRQRTQRMQEDPYWGVGAWRPTPVKPSHKRRKR